MQIPILNGSFTDENSDFRTAYPVNMIPVPKQTGISNGYLRPADGIVEFSSSTPGVDRGGINWKGKCYRVLSDKVVLVESTGTISEIATVTNVNNEPVSFDYSFDYLGLISDNKFYLYNGTTFTQVTDPDLGLPIDLIWVDGYFMLTDGEYLIITELTDPTQIDILKYGSSEADPDPIVAIKKLGNEPYAINRHTIEAFDNIGGSGFPFQRIDGAKINRGAVGTKTCCEFSEGLAFIGSGRNEPISVWYGSGGTSVRLATREIETILSEFSELQLSKVVIEEKTEKGHEFLYIHLSNKTLVYDLKASTITETPVWHILRSTVTGDGTYLAKNFVYCYNKWIVGHPTENKLGYFVSNISSHWGEHIGWEFNTNIFYNSGNSAIIYELELISLTGRTAFLDDPTIWTSFSLDGETWSQEVSIKAGKTGDRKIRLIWFDQGLLENWRIQKFRGLSDSFISPARLEALIEGLLE